MVTIRLKDKKTGIESEEISIEEVVFNQSEIEFIFPYDEGLDATQLPFKDFLFFQDDYEVIIKTKEE